MVHKYWVLFDGKMRSVHGVELRFDFPGVKPISMHPHRWSPAKRAAAKCIVDQFVKEGIMSPAGEPICYYDSSHKKDPKDLKAQYVYVIMMFGGPILWSVKKHNHASISSTDNEYMAQSHACTADSVMWVRGLLSEMGDDDDDDGGGVCI